MLTNYYYVTSAAAERLGRPGRSGKCEKYQMSKEKHHM